MLAKVKCAQVYAGGKDPFDFADGSCPGAMARSIFKDIQRNAAAAV
jgi:hypothetical protein